MTHLSFMINTRIVDGAPLPMGLARCIFSHAHTYYGIGIRMYFMTIPILAWAFTKWCLLAVTPFYLGMIQGTVIQQNFKIISNLVTFQKLF